MAFRLTPQEFEGLEKCFMDHPMVGVRSANQLARKLALDYQAGRLTYANEKDRLLAPDVNQATTPVPA